MKYKKGDLVKVHTVGLCPQIDGVYRVIKRRRFSNFSYTIEYRKEKILLRENEILYRNAQKNNQ